MKKYLILAVALFAATTPALAQQPPPDPSKVDQTVRGSVAGLAQAQTLLLQIPDLVAQINQLQAEVAGLKKQIEAAKPKPPKAGGP